MEKEDEPILLKEFYKISNVEQLRIEPKGRAIRIYVNNEELHYVKSFEVSVTEKDEFLLTVVRYFVQDDFDKMKRYYL